MVLLVSQMVDVLLVSHYMLLLSDFATLTNNTISPSASTKSDMSDNHKKNRPRFPTSATQPEEAHPKSK